MTFEFQFYLIKHTRGKEKYDVWRSHNLPRLYFLSTDGNPEPGGPGTVYFDGYKGGLKHRVLSVDNQGRRARVGSPRKKMIVFIA